MNPGTVLLARDSNTLQRRQSLLQLTERELFWLLAAAFLFSQTPFHFPRAVSCLSPECRL